MGITQLFIIFISLANASAKEIKGESERGKDILALEMVPFPFLKEQTSITKSYFALVV